MKILFLNTNLRRGGVERRTLYLAKAARDAGHQYRILTIDDICDYADLLQRYDLNYESVLERDRFSLLSDLPRLVRAFRAASRDFEPDIVQVFNFHPLLVARLSGMKHLVFAIANAGANRWKRKDLRSKILNRAERWALTPSRVFSVACSEDARQAYRDRFGLSSDRVVTIPNGVDAEMFSRKDSSLPGRSPTILMVGTLSEVKNHSMAIRALALLREQGIDATLRIVGEGPERIRIQTLIEQLRLEGHVELLGLRKDVADLFHQADICWMTSRREGFGQVIVEAFLSGVPVVATNVEGIRTIIDDGTSGLLVPPEDSEALAAKTATLLKDQSLYQGIVERAHRKAMDKYTAERMADAYLDLYGRLSKEN